jgi:hypothetical protein
MAANSSETVTLTYQVGGSVAGGTVLTLSGSVAMPNDANMSDNNASRMITVNGGGQQGNLPPSLVLSVNANSVAAPGSILPLFITIRNIGDVLAQGVTLTITFDSRVLFLTADRSDVALNPGNSLQVDFAPGFLGADHGANPDILSREVDFRVDANATGSHTFHFVITSSNAPTITFDKVVTF